MLGVWTSFKMATPNQLLFVSHTIVVLVCQLRPAVLQLYKRAIILNVNNHLPSTIDSQT